MYDFKFADIGEGIHEGKLLEWNVSVGDTIKNGETLFLVETDKVNAEIPSPVDGVITRLHASVGETIHVGNVIVSIEDGESVEESRNIKENEAPIEELEEKSAGVVGEITVSNNLIPSFHHEVEEKVASKKRILATPVARKLAKDLGIDITIVTGSGTMGRVMKADIYSLHEALNKSKTPKAEDKPISLSYSGETEILPLSSIRKTIARAMVKSKETIPHAVMMDEFDVTELVKFRREAKESAKSKGVNITYLTFILKALSIALKEYPMFNSSFDEETESIIIKKYYNIGIATDTDRGLMVPVLKKVNTLSIIDIASRVSQLVNMSRNASIPLSDLKDGTFSITNYGAVGSLFGTPIIKHPEVAILGIGKIVRKPIFADNGELQSRHIMPISLAIDHRVIDGADAGRFANRLKDLLSDPKLLIMS